MHWILIALTLVSSQPRNAEHARAVANRRARAERRSEAPVLPAPAAGATVQIPVTGSAVDPSGRKYSFSGIVTLTTEDPPPPPVPVIIGVRAAGGTAFVTGALSGASLELVGAGLPTTGILRLTIGDKTATVSQWSPGLISFAAPVVTAAYTGPIILYTQVNNQWTVAAKGPVITLLPGTAEVPALPRVDRFLAADGTAPAAFTIHQALILEGVGFGEKPGRVLVNWLEVPVSAWNSERIVTSTGDGTLPQGALLQILCPTGWFHLRGPRILMP